MLQINFICLVFVVGDTFFCRNFNTMIQRVQSIFLFFAAVALFLTLFFPFWQKVDTVKSEVATLTSLNLTVESFVAGTNERIIIASKSVYYIAIIALLGVIVSIFSVFQFKNRLLQIKLGALNSFLIMICVVATLWSVTKAEAVVEASTAGNYLFGFYLLFVALVCNFLANRFIRKDEMLVRSADRIR